MKEKELCIDVLEKMCRCLFLNARIEPGRLADMLFVRRDDEIISRVWLEQAARIAALWSDVSYYISSDDKGLYLAIYLNR